MLNPFNQLVGCKGEEWKFEDPLLRWRVILSLNCFIYFTFLPLTNQMINKHSPVCFDQAKHIFVHYNQLWRQDNLHLSPDTILHILKWFLECWNLALMMFPFLFEENVQLFSQMWRCHHHKYLRWIQRISVRYTNVKNFVICLSKLFYNKNIINYAS